MVLLEVVKVVVQEVVALKAEVNLVMEKLTAVAFLAQLPMVEIFHREVVQQKEMLAKSLALLHQINLHLL